MFEGEKVTYRNKELSCGRSLRSILIFNNEDIRESPVEGAFERNFAWEVETTKSIEHIKKNNPKSLYFICFLTTWIMVDNSSKCIFVLISMLGRVKNI